MAKNITANPRTVLREKMRELGYPAIEPPVSNSVGPNDSQFAVPQFLTFAGLVNQVSRTFRYTFDEAMLNSPVNARAMRRDPSLMDALRSTQIPVCQLGFHLKAKDETDPQQMYAAANVKQIVDDIPRFQWMKLHLMEAKWYGRYGSQMILRPDFSMKYKRWVVKDHRPMNGDKLVFKWSGDVGVLVHPLYDGDIQMTDRGLCHFFTPVERQTVLIHHYEPEDQDFYEYQMAGAVEGVGVRSRLYYFWYLKSKIFEYLMTYMQRTGLGIDVFYYDFGNPQSLAQMKMAAENQIGNLRLLLPRNKDTQGTGYEHHEASHQGAHLFIEMLSDYFDAQMRRYILGQSLTTEVGSTGLGSGVAGAHQMTEEMRIQYDATALAETLTEELLKPLYRWNHSGIPCAKFVFDVEKPNQAEYMQAAQLLYMMGVAVDADDLRSVCGLPKPEPGHDIVSKFQANQASTVGVPQGTPVESAGPQSAAQYSRKGYPVLNIDGKPYRYAPELHDDNLLNPMTEANDMGGMNQRFSFNGDGVIPRPVEPILRNSKVHKALDEFLALQHNRNGRRSWSTVGGV